MPSLLVPNSYGFELMFPSNVSSRRFFNDRSLCVYRRPLHIDMIPDRDHNFNSISAVHLEVLPDVKMNIKQAAACCAQRSTIELNLVVDSVIFRMEVDAEDIPCSVNSIRAKHLKRRHRSVKRCWQTQSNAR